MKLIPMRFPSAVLAGLLLADPAAFAQRRAPDAPVLLQAAVHQETVNGNLDSAIALYRRVATDRRADRVTIAKALIGLGRAHETLGQSEAQRAYERVVNEFGDLLDQVSVARQRLAALSHPLTAKSVVTGGLSLRRIWHDPGVDMEGQPTPDWRLLTFVDWETGDLAVRDVATGTKRPLTRTGYPQYALGSSVSPDGRLAAYFWTPGEGKDWQPQLRVIGLDGSGERTLIANADRDITYFTPFEWTPDGRNVLLVIQRRAGIEIALVDTRSGAIRTIKSLDWRQPMRAALSPDGRWIAYDFQESREKPQRDLFVLAADGSAEHRLTNHPANDLHGIWLSNTEIVFASMRGGSVGLWRARLQNGRSVGDPELVKPDMTPGFYPMGVTASGTLFYSQDTGGGDIFTVTFDPAEARIVGQPQRLGLRYQGFNSAGDFGATTDTLIYASRRDALSIGHTMGVYLHDLKSGTERHLNVYTARPFARPRLSPDGKRALLWTRTLRGGDRIVLVNLEAGTSKDLVEPVFQTQGALGNAVWSRDGKSIYYFRNDAYSRNDTAGPDGSQPRIVKRDVATGDEQVVHRFDLAWVRWTWALSPDERSIAYTGRQRAPEVPSVLSSETYLLRVAPLGGPGRDLVRLAPPQAVSQWTSVSWTPDGRHLLYGVTANRRWEGDRNVTVYSVPVDGGAPRETGLRMPEFRHPSFLPDGRTLTFTAGPSTFNEIWMMENLRTASSR